MNMNFIDKLGDWNPQLLRELKGRLKVFPTLIAVATSLLVQIVVFLYQLRELPDEKYSMYGQYCKLGLTYEQVRSKLETELSTQSQQLQEQFRLYSSPDEYNSVKLQEVRSQIAQVEDRQNQIYQSLENQFCPIDQINMQLWWRDHWEYIFISLSVIFIFTLLVAGTYLLINNLAQEERRGTLNFIRLTPQSETSILTGKLLGVPILIYLVILTALPLHFWAGHSANIAFSYILSFWVVLAACSIFFYSTALLFGLSCRWLSGFQPWLGSGAVLLFLIMTIGLASSRTQNYPLAWLRMFSPFDITNYLFPNVFRTYSGSQLKGLHQFFNLELGQTVVGLVSFHILNYGLWTYWAWQSMKRCFRNPNSTILSKRQSYFLVGCLQIVNLGFYVGYQTNNKFNIYNVQSHLAGQWFLNLLMFLGLIAIISQDRQIIQDWARYRHQNVSTSNRGNNSLLSDLIRGEKSPAILAIAINLVIAATPFLVWIILWHNLADVDLVDKIKAVLGVALFITLIMISATLAQLLLLMKTYSRNFWAIGTVTATVFLPPMILGILGISPKENQLLWLFSSFSWVGIPKAASTTIFMAFLGQLSILALLTFQLIRQVRLAGESATKALLAER